MVDNTNMFTFFWLIIKPYHFYYDFIKSYYIILLNCFILLCHNYLFSTVYYSLSIFIFIILLVLLSPFKFYLMLCCMFYFNSYLCYCIHYHLISLFILCNTLSKKYREKTNSFILFFFYKFSSLNLLFLFRLLFF